MYLSNQSCAAPYFLLLIIAKKRSLECAERAATVTKRINTQQQSSSHDTDRDILESFFNSTRGINWHRNTNWGTAEPLHNWEGVEVNPKGEVTSITLPNNNIVGRCTS